MNIRIIKRKVSGCFVTQCVILNGIAYNIGGWTGIWKNKRMHENDSPTDHAYILMRSQSNIPKNAPVLTNNQIIRIANKYWVVHSKREIDSAGKEYTFAWLTSN